MNTNKRVLVLGSTGFLGKHVVKKLNQFGYKDIIGTSLSSGLDLRNTNEVIAYFKRINPNVVINCASFVGGITWGKKYPADIFTNNSLMIANILNASNNAGIDRLINPISNCAYPAKLEYFQEKDFWNGDMHETVLSYGLTRKAIVVGSWSYAQQYGLDAINLVLSNMFGPEDHFEPERSHALGALVGRIYEAKEKKAESIDVWGSGKPIREWLFVEDGAEALVRAINCTPTTELTNVGVGTGISVKDLAKCISDVIGFKGILKFDLSKPDGAPCKTVDGSKGEALLNWTPSTSFVDAIKQTISSYEIFRKPSSDENLATINEKSSSAECLNT